MQSADERVSVSVNRNGHKGAVCMYGIYIEREPHLHCHQLCLQQVDLLFQVCEAFRVLFVKPSDQLPLELTTS